MPSTSASTSTEPGTRGYRGRHSVLNPAKLVDLPDRPSGLDPLSGSAVAFPDVDLASLPRGYMATTLLGIEAPKGLVLDATALETVDGIRAWLDRVFANRTGDGGGRRRPRGPKGVQLVDELLRPTVSLRRLVRGRIEDDRGVEPTIGLEPRTC